MSIQDFKSNLISGARPNQFRVLLTFPSWVPSGPVAAVQAGFLVNATSLPESSIGTTPIAYRGRSIPYAGERVFSPWTVNVINDVDFNIRNAFEIWSQGMNENLTNRGRTMSRQYQTNAVIQQLDRNDYVLKEYTMVDVFPSDVGGIQLNYNTNDVIEEFPVTLQYTYWVSNTTATSGETTNYGLNFGLSIGG